MRKAAGLKRNSRKKEQRGVSTHAPPPPPQQDPRVEQRPFRPAAVPPEMQRGKRPSPNEAALTAKNYRMAKELAELRIRLREETKKTSRMTMENMGLKSRCRESASHIAMLRQELAMHQHRAQEALALQRQQTQRMAIDLSAEVIKRNSFDESPTRGEAVSHPHIASDRVVPEESQDIGRFLSAIAPPPPPPPQQGFPATMAMAESKGLLDQMRSQPPPPPPRILPTVEQEEDEDVDVTMDEDVEDDNVDVVPNDEDDFVEEDVSLFVESNESDGNRSSPTAIPFDDIDEGDEEEPELGAIHVGFDSSSKEGISHSPDSPDSSGEEKEHRLTPVRFAGRNSSFIEGTPDKDDTIVDDEGDCLDDGPVTNGVRLFPFSALPEPFMTSQGQNYDEQFPSDIIERPKRPQHPHPTFGHKLSGDVDEQEEDASDSSNGKDSNDSASSGQTQPTASTSLTPSSGQSGKSQSSIDAFEASFATTFPPNFSPKDGSATKYKRSSSDSEIYNPFFPSPSKISVRGDVVSPQENRRSSTSAVSNHQRPNIVPMDTSPQFSARSGSSSHHYPRTPEEKAQWDEDPYHTPPQNMPQMRVFPDESLKRPEKKGSMAARARYEKALQPRSGSSNPKSAVGVDPKTNESPDSLFKRIQRRRAKMSKSQLHEDESMALTDPIASDSSSSHSDRNWTPILRTEQPFDEAERAQSERLIRAYQRRPSNTDREIHKGHDSRSRVVTAFSNDQPQEHYPVRQSRRRSVKQPISYAEPALNTKLRKGDVFFTKVAPESMTIVTPEASPMESGLG